MQRLRYSLAILLSCLLPNLLLAQQNVGIGTTTPNSSAMLDIVSTTKGVLIPRAETSAISSPVAGLIVYQPSDNSVYYHNGTVWQKLSGGSIVDADGDTRVTALNATGSVDSILFEIDSQKKLVLKRNPAGDLMMEPIGGGLNTFHGIDAGQSLDFGSFNSGFGAFALKTNQNGNFNTGIGYESLTGNTGGAMNTALGASSLSLNSYGNFNTANGVSALQLNITGSYNVASGFNALRTNSEGYNNTSIGANALWANTMGSGNVAARSKALYNNTTANGNVAIGRDALGSTTTHEHLVAIGDSALYFNQTGFTSAVDGEGNTAVGSRALLKNTIGSYNTAFGWDALKNNINGTYHTALGTGALRSQQDGFGNTAVGVQALYAHTTGNANTVVGLESFGSNTFGSSNIGLGWRSGFNNIIGSYNIFIGTQAGNNELGSNKLYLENSSADATQALIYGEFDNNLLRVNGNMEVNIYAPAKPGVRSIIQAPSGTYSDVPGVYGENIIDDYYGIGVHGKGGYYGVVGEAPGTSTGVYTGVRGVASGLSGAQTYGVYGEASGGSVNYGGYFVGNGHFSGALGIGIGGSPSEQLQIFATDDPTILIQSDGVDEVSGKLAMRQSNLTGVDMFYDGQSSADAIVFETFINGTSQGRKMTMDLSGNVGIGITENIATGHKLSVNGKIACTEVRVQPQNEWPDYVFAEDYTLMPLDELKSSIEASNHLPGIPSAKEVQAEGIQLGDMQIRMMEKLEEMTLYILQLNEEIKTLKQENLKQAEVLAKLK